MSDELTTLTDATFDEATAGTPTLIKFEADWCGPCRVYAPAYKQAAVAYTGGVTFAVVDIDASPETARRFGVMSIPTTIAVDAAGEVVGKLVGVQTAAAVAGLADKAR